MATIKKSHRGLLHKDLHVPKGEHIPFGKVAAALHSSNPKIRRRAQFDKNMNYSKR